MQEAFSSGGFIDHGTLLGLADDDHLQYILVDGTRAFTGSIEIDKAVGDPVIVFDTVGADRWTLGVDDDDSDKFKITPGATLTNPAAFEIESDGDLEIGKDIQLEGGICVGDVAHVPVKGTIMLLNVAAPGNPPAGHGILYDTADKLYFKEPGGIVYQMVGDSHEFAGDVEIDDGLVVGSLAQAPAAGVIEVYRAAGDPRLRFDIGGADKFTVGVDDDDGDKFKINSGGALATPSDWELDAAGNVFQGGTLLTMGMAYLKNVEVWSDAADPIVWFSVLTVDKWTIGADVSDGDKFKINSGFGLADPSDFEISAAGDVEVASHLRMGNGDRTTLFDLLFEKGHHAANASHYIAEADDHESSA